MIRRRHKEHIRAKGHRSAQISMKEGVEAFGLAQPRRCGAAVLVAFDPDVVTQARKERIAALLRHR